MIRSDYLNAASDLRRIALWMKLGNKQNLSLIMRFWEESISKPQVKKYIDTKFDPEKIFDDDSKRRRFAEDALMSSIRLQNQGTL